ncbi:hypothetical protein Tco_0243878 [Tanacetum coccineum]
MAVRTQPTQSPGMLARIVEATTLSPSSFHKSLDSDAEREGHGLDDEVHGLDDEGHGLDDEGHGLDDEGPGSEEEATPEGQQQAVPVVDTAASKPLGLGYGALRRRELALG